MKPALQMTDDELSAERRSLEAKWDECRAAIADDGMAGSPGEWIIERLDEVNGERTRRVISLDTDVKIDPMTAERVKPCPFCGVRPEVMTSGERRRGLMIHCISENCANPSVSYYDHETALSVWNQRDGRETF